MKKNVIKSIVMGFVFLIAIIVFGVITNHTNEDLTTTMQPARLPVISFYYNQVEINELHGYVTEMDKTMVRDGIVPIGDERTISLEVDTYGANVDDIRYEIRGLDGERLLADGELVDYQSTENKISAQFTVQNLLEEDEEYLLVLILEIEKEPVYYYTRIMRTVDCYTKECMDFALLFHEYTFRDDAGEFIPTYMDPATGDATTLNYVDLTCTLKQITWADFDGQQYGKVMASFKEINDSYNVVLLDYLVTYTNESGEVEYYNVEEYYRLRWTSTRMYVLNFERRMSQIFRGENTFLTDTSNIQLGIRDTDVDYAANESQSVIAFVQEGELWCYNVGTNELECVFSFRSPEGMDARENWNKHDIHIVRLDEAGSLDFIVYGYMNRGVHEGEVGVGVYHYDGIAHTVEEEAFIPMTQSFEVLRAELGQLMYENDMGYLYLMMNGDVYEINLSSRSVKTIITGLKDGSYATSDSGRFLAWIPADAMYSSRSLQIMDLKDGTVHEVSQETGTYVRPLAFMDEDFIYGIADKEDVVEDASGKTTFAMKELTIIGTSENDFSVLKNYLPQKGFVGNVSVSDNTIMVDVIRMQDGQYVADGTDAIMNREADTSEYVNVTTTVTDIKETQVQLVLKSKADRNKKTKLIIAKSVLVEENRLVHLELNQKEERFYVYAKGEVLLATDSISEAILTANDALGIVVDSSQQYIWKRARKSAQTAFASMEPNEADKDANSIVQCVSAILMREDVGISVKELVEMGQSPKEILESTLKDCVVLDLSGCTAEEILFYVSKGNPVFAMTGSDSAVLVTGYSSSNIYYYDPQTGITSSRSMEQADEWFHSAGNVFFSYL